MIHFNRCLFALSFWIKVRHFSSYKILISGMTAQCNTYSMKKYSIDDWKNYLKFHLMNGLSDYLDDKTYMESFNFYSTTLEGVKEPKPIWERVVRQTNGALGELIGQVYVNEYLPKGTKEKLEEIGNSIKSVFAQRIKALDWMSAPTKEKALKKLNGVIMKVGYPDKWKDLSAMQIDRSSYVKNVMSANKWGFNYMISKYGKPVDRKEWGMFRHYPFKHIVYIVFLNSSFCICN